MIENKVKIASNTFIIHPLGESALVLMTEKISLIDIHQTALAIEKALKNEIIDIVTAYQSITIYFNALAVSWDYLLEKLSSIALFDDQKIKIKTHEIIVDFEKGLDWQMMEAATNLSRKQMIFLFLEKKYTVAMLGFIPGFIYLEGLNKRLACPRKKAPRIKTPKGSIGIGGMQAGIYALSSPSGWQIIGQTTTASIQFHSINSTSILPLHHVIFKAK